MKLIADCGSTKINWCLIENGEVVKQIFTSGMNAVMLSQQEITERIATELMPQLSDYVVHSVYFYGAGCISDAVCSNVANAIRNNIKDAAVEVYTDLLAAARALLGNKPGIACILGTGSNSCYFDGTNIVENVSPLGYILGDEGSGAVLGKRLIGDVLKKQLPQELCEKFMTQYNLDPITIIQRVYREPQANRFLALVSPFLLQNIDEPAIHTLVLDSFVLFFKRNVMLYPNHKNHKVNFVGSIAYYYKDLLAEAAAQCGCTIGTVLKSPMQGLIAFHS
jgi:N-acetylglucosamine kinase-like BadF-type ATPase